ncbi:polymorphic toxin type 44 domain-containing protein [Paenibacillus sp. KN14-4R]|uniref:polymorphic toxin type 44 domain-containing protein n=1 Tax=Paenibacillus sp. KN14-4R TaxID=3445773 RepID=UPI003FA03324
MSYGYLGKVFGFTDEKLYYGAGVAQKISRTSLSEWDAAPYYGDDPFENYNIQWGINIYNKWYSN